MRVLVISDIHANRIALEAVLEDAGQRDAVWCLGDLVGYGPEPNQCLEIIRSLPNLICLRGNHDSAVCGLTRKGDFNLSAQKVLRWTEQELTQDNQRYLASLPARTETGDVTLAHGSPRRPIWEYIMDSSTARENFEHFETDYCLVGHSHFPVLYIQREGSRQVESAPLGGNEERRLIKRSIVNPGSVGQPRDQDSRASYAVYQTDTQTWKQVRVAYQIAAVQKKMHEAGLPGEYIRRLELGW